MEYGFLVERSKIEKTSFLYKTAISEVNVKANRMATTKCTNYKLQYYREQSFASNCFIFLKVLFQVKNLFINDWFNVPTTQTPIFVLFLSSRILFEGDFPLWVSLRVSRWKNSKILPSRSSFSSIFDEMFIKVPWLHNTLSPLPWKFSHCAPALRDYSLCKTLHLKCLTKFWIRLFLDNGSVINTVITCYLLHQTRILAYSVIFIVVKAYSNMLRG